MSDPAAAWRAHQLKAGERALEMLAAGAKWREIAAALHLGEPADAQRAAALALAADVARQREASQ